jgi:hypothetical protein
MASKTPSESERIHKVFSAVLSDEQFQIRDLGLLRSNST